jgi:hypothetical protein
LERTRDRGSGQGSIGHLLMSLPRANLRFDSLQYPVSTSHLPAPSVVHLTTPVSEGFYRPSHPTICFATMCHPTLSRESSRICPRFLPKSKVCGMSVRLGYRWSFQQRPVGGAHLQRLSRSGLKYRKSALEVHGPPFLQPPPLTIRSPRIRAG